MKDTLLMILLAPLVGSLIAGLVGWKIGRIWTHRLVIFGVFVSFLLSCNVFAQLVFFNYESLNTSVYQLMVADGIKLEVGFLLDELSALMLVVVNFVSLMVHIYTIGYMDKDEDYGLQNNYYQRFFCYISLFTFAMLALVLSNNFLQLFFGWEAVGLVSYLLIGFYMKRESAIKANLKAFIVNRVGDFGFLIGIAMVVMYFNTLDYQEFFDLLASKENTYINIGFGDWSVITMMTFCLFVGAMGKSAQMPLHVWLPESMEGPTPISALIHAATMVTAGIFMVARLSPAFEFSEATLSFIIIVGASTAFFMGLLGLVQNDIKRIIAYSTLSQLGYMICALGASAYAASVFHVMTHAFFKAVLFLGAGSVIIAMHHIQDITKMGGLRKHMPITHMTMLIGTIALIGFPGFAGFFSKDSIILAVEHSNIFGASYAAILLVAGTFVTSFYSFRLLFRVFYGEQGEYVKTHTIKESPMAITLPLIALAIPSIIAGYTIIPFIFGDFFANSIQVLPEHDVLQQLTLMTNGITGMLLHSLVDFPLWLTLLGAILAWFFVLKRADLGDMIVSRLSWLSKGLHKGYYFDAFNQTVLVQGTIKTGQFLWQYADATVIDGWIVNGIAKKVSALASSLRKIQTGFLYHYAFYMIIVMLLILAWIML